MNYDFVKTTKHYPYVYENKELVLNVRLLDYITTSCDILQHLT